MPYVIDRDAKGRFTVSHGGTIIGTYKTKLQAKTCAALLSGRSGRIEYTRKAGGR